MQPSKYVKKPIEIEAVQFVGGEVNGVDIVSWIASEGGKATWVPLREATYDDEGLLYVERPNHLVIETLEGDMRCFADSFIIKGIKGEFYPCDPDIFRDSYSAVADLD